MKEHIRRYHTNSYYELQCEYCVYQCGVRHQLHCMYMLYDTVTKYSTDHIGGVMISVLASSAVDRGFESRYS
jgi:hypothetical protein